MIRKNIYSYSKEIKKIVKEKYNIDMPESEINTLLRYTMKNINQATNSYNTIYLKSFMIIHQDIVKIINMGYTHWKQLKKFTNKTNKRRTFNNSDIDTIF
jgi:competence CoiA-like predicted nuclease